MNTSYIELLKLAVPETILVVTAFVVLAMDLLFTRVEPLRVRFSIGAMISIFGCIAAAAWMYFGPHADLLATQALDELPLMKGMLVVDPLTQLVSVAILVLAVFTILLSVESNFTSHVGEYLALILLATVGMLFLVSTEDILMIFISLELTSLSLYILTAFNKQNIKSAEAALKYFLFGGMAAAFTLFGLSLIYGLSGSTNLRDIAAAFQGKGLDPLLVVAIVMTVIGFGFKLAAVPFHLWAPDAYQGAPIPSAAFIASGSKVASFFIFTKVMMLGFAGVEGSGAFRQFQNGWVPTLAILAVFSMLLGNLVAIAQSSVRRLLAYSAIAHAGYMLFGVMTHNGQGMASLLYYAITYGLTTIGAFGVVAVVQERAGDDKISDFAGLARREPIVSLCMMVFMLSLAGIPPLAGFFGKFYIFATAITTGSNSLGLLWLVIFAIAMSVVSLYYYLKILKQIYVVEDAGDFSTQTSSMLVRVALCLLALAVVILGCAPDLLLQALQHAIKQAGF